MYVVMISHMVHDDSEESEYKSTHLAFEEHPTFSDLKKLMMIPDSFDGSEKVPEHLSFDTPEISVMIRMQSIEVINNSTSESED